MTTSTTPDRDRPEVVLHAEELQVSLRSVPVERVRVRRRVVSYTRQVEVTVRREELEIERVPVDGAEAAPGTSTGAGLVVVLSEEVPVVSVRTRPYERVTISVDRVAGEQDVSTALSHEVAEVTEETEMTEETQDGRRVSP